IYELKTKFASIKEIVELSSKQNDADIPNIYNFISKWYSDIENYAPADVCIDDHIALIMFSSGTTGLPKGVMLTHRNFNTRRAITLEPSCIYEPKTKVTLGVLPFFHLFGLNTVITGLVHGRMVVVIEKFDPILYLSCLEKYKIETISAAPAIVQLLAKSPLVDRFNLSHVKDLVVGSAPLSRTLEEAVKRRLPIKYVRQGYSMTEGTATFVTVPPNTERLGSCGKLYPTVIGVVKDIETGENLGPLKSGELCFKGNIIMKGYYRNEEATREAFTRDGYLKTGDIGYYDHDGYFYVIDRIKELIKYKGYQVAPAELESILIAHPKIRDVAVVGIPNVDAGELPMALVALQPNADVSENDVKTYLNRYVSAHKSLHGGVKFVGEIPRNSLGKINRKEIKALAANITKSKL
ncbi:AMP-binding protein, partial [Oryctes borbonicus]